MKLLAVPNFSTGRDEQAISALGGALGGSGAEVLDCHADEIHDRVVFTLAGSDDQLRTGLVAGARKAMEAIDMTSYRGQHPAIGAIDVCPVVFRDDEDREAAERLARGLGSELSGAGLPVFFYGAMAAGEKRRERSHFRRGGLAELRRRMESDELEPDLGPPEPHPTAGAVLVSARKPLGAFNVELAGIDLLAGRKVARRLRERGGGMPGVRAIAIDFGEGKIQISTNVNDPAQTPLGLVVERVWELARPLGGTPVEAELVGLIPRAALEDYPDDVPIRGFDPEQHTLEARLGE